MRGVDVAVNCRFYCLPISEINILYSVEVIYIMLNYKECCLEDFNKAMGQKNEDVGTISNEYLYILYTKFMEDARQCFYIGTSYARSIGYKSGQQAEMYKTELQRRGVIL